MDIHEKIAVMQAFADGKEIEFNWGGGWQLCPKPAWDWSKLNYRIKPERTITLNTNPQAHIIFWSNIEPCGKLWDLVKDKIELRVIEPPTHAMGRKLIHPIQIYFNP